MSLEPRIGTQFGTDAAHDRTLTGGGLHLTALQNIIHNKTLPIHIRNPSKPSLRRRNRKPPRAALGQIKVPEPDAHNLDRRDAFKNSGLPGSCLRGAESTDCVVVALLGSCVAGCHHHWAKGMNDRIEPTESASVLAENSQRHHEQTHPLTQPMSTTAIAVFFSKCSIAPSAPANNRLFSMNRSSTPPCSLIIHPPSPRSSVGKSRIFCHQLATPAAPLGSSEGETETVEPMTRLPGACFLAKGTHHVGS